MNGTEQIFAVNYKKKSKKKNKKMMIIKNLQRNKPTINQC